MNPLSNSHTAFEQAKQVIPGGVNSPVRAFQSVGGEPVYFAHGQGAEVTDIDGNRYIDYVNSWGCMILGHAAPEVSQAVEAQAARALGFGAPTLGETALANKLTEHIPGMDAVRLVNSGTEATMSALRLARGFTGRDLIVKFKGCYHGHVDALLLGAGSGVLTLGIPGSPGVPEGVVRDTLNLEYNDLEAVDAAFDTHGERIAAVILEPIAGNMGCIPSEPEFLARLRERTRKSGSLLIFDEVMSGFRVALGGAAEHYGITPDLTTLGKIIGGGLPIGAFGGRAEIMRHLAPAGPVYQAGTLSGNPVAVAAGLTTLERVEQPRFHQYIASHTRALAEGLQHAAAATGVNLQVNQVCGMIGIFFSDQGPVRSFVDAERSDTAAYAKFFHAMLKRGVYLAPSAFETMFVSAAHDQTTLKATLKAAESSLQEIQEPG